MSWRWHYADAQERGLISEDGSLTKLGRAIGEACQHLPDGRAYMHFKAYEKIAADIEASIKRDGHE